MLLVAKWKVREARLANRDQTIELDREPDDAALVDARELLGQDDAAHDGLVRRFDPAHRERDRKWRFRRAAHADQNDVGLREVARLFSVVALDRELDGLDAPVVLVAEPVYGRRIHQSSSKRPFS